MDTDTIKFIGKDRVEINGVIFKRLKTFEGKYSKEDRNRYMKKYRAKRQVILSNNAKT